MTAAAGARAPELTLATDEGTQGAPADYRGGRLALCFHPASTSP
jgi:peroxiredoxin